MVAIGLIAATRSRLRWLWLLHPLLTLLVIVGTANHYWLDAIVATALLGIALAVIRLPRGAGATEAHGLVAAEASEEADGEAGNSGGAGGAGEKESVPELVGARR
jgi:hypothetical protein